jgi:ADP-L-glycero-D-manno-heptose 6-epimerase
MEFVVETKPFYVIMQQMSLSTEGFSMKTYLVTGGGGFIGSNIAAALTKHYPDARIVVCDVYGTGDKWRNNVKHPVDETIAPGELFYWLETNVDTLDAVVHMGAISSTTETNADLTLETNFTLPKILRGWCVERGKRFIYASSGATYGDGEHGFDDDFSLEYQLKLKPLNMYAFSKRAFDYFLARSIHRNEPQPVQQVGLKFFNVYGPNEYHKDDQKSVVAQIFPHAAKGLPVHLFRSYRPDYKDGGQLRDFIYVKDCVKVVLWLLDNPQVNGLFNVGTGNARSFEDLARATFAAVGKEPRITYTDMPETIKHKYQYFTEAKMDRLRAVGYDKPFYSLEDGVKDYVQNYLMQPDAYL